ncbi:hypothetical protein Tco_1427125 [Tanacetum coccineum]
MEDDTNADSIDYPDEPRTDDEDPKEDPSEEHDIEDEDEDPEEDPSEEHEPEDEDAKEDESSEDSDETEPFEENKITATPPPHRHHGARISRRFVLTAPPPGCHVVESSSAAAARASRGQYDFVDVVGTGQVRALQASERRMMTSIEEVNLRVIYQVHAHKRESEDFYTQLLDAQTDRIDIRLEIDVVRGQRTAYETELIMPVTRQGTNDAMTPESIQAMIDQAIQRNSTQDDRCQSLGGGIRRPVQPARVCSYLNFIKCQPLNFKGTEGVVGLSYWLKKMESIFHISGCAVENQVMFATCTLLGAALTWWNGHVRTLGHDAAYLTLICTKFLADEIAKIDKYIGGLPDNIHGNVMSVRSKTLYFAIELANDLMDQKLRTYAERQNEIRRRLMIHQETINNPTRSKM